MKITPIKKNSIKKLTPSLSEAWNIWKMCCSEDFLYKPLDEKDVNSKSKSCLNKIIKNHLIYQNKNRFVTKITGPPKMRYLNDVFSDSLFVYIIRDGRGVVNSLINVDFWKKRGGFEKPWWGSLPSDLEKVWIDSNKSPLVLAALQWKYMIILFEEEKEYLSKDRILLIKYEDICVDKVNTLKKIIDFCELKWDKEFEDYVKSVKVKNMNFKWKEKMNLDQQRTIDDLLKDTLSRYGYK